MKTNLVIIIVALSTFLMVSIATCSVRYSEEDKYYFEMVQDIKTKEALLDSLDNHMPFSDTVGEGDSYFELCEARNKFFKAENNETAEIYHDQYQKYFTKVCLECINFLNKRNVEE